MILEGVENRAGCVTMTDSIAASATVKDHLDGTTFDPCFSAEKRPLKRVPIFVGSAL